MEQRYIDIIILIDMECGGGERMWKEYGNIIWNLETKLFVEHIIQMTIAYQYHQHVYCTWYIAYCTIIMMYHLKQSDFCCLLSCCMLFP